jgi:DNA mismatch repair protein MutL
VKHCASPFVHDEPLKQGYCHFTVHHNIYVCIFGPLSSVLSPLFSICCSSMPISALPAETVRLLGSPVVYTSPVSFVKEFVDNAIDAQATAIEILIAPNTLDSIEVRDNGHGIHPQDFSTIGRRGHTSKLRKFEDIQTVGSITLGFRGDALACAAVLSTLTITTRAAGEPTASKLHLAEKGGVEKVERVSGPFGTAVKVAHLFSRLPVRKQVALKEASKTIAKIRELQHTYFFARPHLRLALKILGHPKGAWSCAPGLRPSLREAACQIFGAELVSQCDERTMSAAADETNHSKTQSTATLGTQGKGHYVIEAFLPKPGADPAKISKWPFLSVDSRPVSHTKGTMKTLYAAFKTRLNRNLELTGSKVTPKTPFLALNIKCPPGSYDPNIEPSKDEVLFANAQHLVTIFERFIDEVYPHPPVSETADHQVGQGQESHLPSPPASDLRARPGMQHRIEPPSPVPQRPANPTRMTIEEMEKLEEPTLDSRAPIEHQQPTAASDTGPHGNSRTAASSLQRPPDLAIVSEQALATLARQKDVQRPNVNGSYGKTGGSGGNTDTPVAETGLARRESRPAFQVDMSEEAERIPKPRAAKPGRDLNPWVIAKRNSTHTQGQPADDHGVSAAQSTHNESPRADHAEDRLAMLGRLAHLPDGNQGVGNQEVNGLLPAANMGSPRVPGGAFRSPVIHNTTDNPACAPEARQHRRPRKSFAAGHEDDEFQPPRSYHRQNSKRARPDEGLVQATLDFGSRSYGNTRRNKPTVTNSAEVLGQGLPRVTQEEAEPDVNIDLAAIRRRQIMAENHRMRDQQLEASQDAETAEATRPPRTSVEAPVPPETDTSNDKDSAKSNLPAGDPRAYLMRRGCSLPATTPRKLRRVKSCLLPLETTPAGYELHNLVETMSLNMKELVRSVQSAADYGLHMPDFTCQEPLRSSISRSEFKEIQQRVMDLLLKLGFDTSNSECEIEFISTSKMLGKSRQI